MNQTYEYDVVIIGGGVTGAAIARELSRYRLRICLLEKEEDVCSGTSKANSAIVHAGFDAKPGSWKARMNVEGNRMMDELAKDLEIPFRRNGSMVVCFSREELPRLQKLKEQGEQNGVPGLRILTEEEAKAMEPNLADAVCGALYAPTGGIVCPFELTLALAENARANGVDFFFDTEVIRIARLEEGYETITTKGQFRSGYVVNAAGLWADHFHNMVSADKITIIPRRGSYCLMDKGTGSHVNSTIFQLPGEHGKGILVTPTVHGNLLIGPTAVDLSDREDTAATAKELEAVQSISAASVKNIPYRQTITSFAGLRACQTGRDFILGEPRDARGFFDAAGIESPGLSSAPAIGQYLARRIAEASGAKIREDFIPCRKGIVKAASLPFEERRRLIAQNPAYGAIVCRCEQISEGEILDAISRPLGARSMDGIKRRVRAGMGRCQGGFCTPRVMELLAEARHLPMEEICKNSSGSELLKGEEQHERV
ncbi:MAG: NAD(P)/FAD-dependent oxidoreductase [Candidatus Limivivens sp.]|nr:NAD(P)/FAD-dependent oxidoreductase [Candidatus Limivivens sp.]